jgi:hypothetical protein
MPSTMSLRIAVLGVGKIEDADQRLPNLGGGGHALDYVAYQAVPRVARYREKRMSRTGRRDGGGCTSSEANLQGA